MAWRGVPVTFAIGYGMSAAPCVAQSVRDLELGAPALIVENLDGRPIGAIGDVRILSDRTVLVSDRTDNRLVRIGLDGTTIARIGRIGGGPGEYRQVFSVTTTPDDTVYVFDPSQGHVVFGPSGRFVRVRPVHGPGPRPPFPVGWMANGLGLAFDEIPGPFRDGQWTDSARVLLVGPDLQRVATLGVEPLVLRRRERGEPGPVPFAPRLLGLAIRGHYCFGFSAHLELRCGKVGSNALTVVVDDRRAGPVTSRLMVEYRRRTLAPPGEPLAAVPPALRGQRVDLVATLRFPDSLPVMGALLGDSESGEIWVRDYVPEDELPGADLDQHLVEERWTVFKLPTKRLGRYRLPRGFRLKDVRGHLVAGIAHDEDGVQRLVVYRLPSDGR